ncbi:MAG: hypothetical protein HIU85_03425 [Proteobacteria bacterium]|nr:hypothetical protein [Pseudomonadota bacterium]
MIFVVDAAARRHFAADLAIMHRQRKAVFVDCAGWKIPVVAGQEADCYDLLQDSVYLLAKEQPRGPVLASARLLTTTGPHLMQVLYARADLAAVPSGPKVWEASRYCSDPGIAGRSKRLGLLWEVICGVMETALAHGVNQVIFAANRALLPLALHCGWQASIVGPTQKDGDDEFTAVAASMTVQGLRNVRERYGIAAPITFAVGAHPESGNTPAHPNVRPPQHARAP